MTVPTEEPQIHRAIDQPLGALGGRLTARIEEIRIQNFRALEDVRLSLQDLTFLVGRNGAGKSSILDAVEFMREAVTDSLPNALARRDGFEGVCRRTQNAGDSIAIAVVMRADLVGRSVRMLYGFRLFAARTGRDYEEVLRVAPTATLGFERKGTKFLSTVVASPAVNKDRLVLPLVATEQLWNIALSTLAQMRAYEISPPAIATPAPIRNSTNLDRNGSNAGDVVGELVDRTPAYLELLQSLQAVVPGLLGVKSTASLGRRIVEFAQSVGDAECLFNAGVMSQGTLRGLGMLLALHQQPQPSLVLIDEVEDSIHPRALEAILEAAEVFTDRFPVVMTTHSPEVLSAKQVTPDRLRVVQWDAGASHIYLLSDGTRESVDPVTSVGDLLRINALWPRDSPERVHGDILELHE